MKPEKKELKRIQVTEGELRDLLDRTQSVLSTKDYELLVRAVESFVYMTRLVEDQDMTISKLRKLAFGTKSEKLAALFEEETKEEAGESSCKDENKAPGEAGAETSAAPWGLKEQAKLMAAPLAPKVRAGGGGSLRREAK